MSRCIRVGEKYRINKFLARAGIGSRREVEKFILDGKVSVNGKTIDDLATQINPDSDSVEFDGKPISLKEKVYYLYYKPRGVVSTLKDTHGRECIGDVIKRNHLPDGTVSIGRLDMDSEGLLILTNDGDFANTMMHPSHEVKKVYRVLIDSYPKEPDLQNLRDGIDTGEFTGKAEKVLRMGPQSKDDEHPDGGYWLNIEMLEGKKREIREMLKAVGYSVNRLIRIAHGSYNISQLKPGDLLEFNPSGTRMRIRQEPMISGGGV